MIQYIMLKYALKVAACILALSIGFYLYAMAMCKCIRQKLFAIGQNSKASARIKHIRIWDQLIEFIEFHSRVKQLSWFYDDRWQILFIFEEQKPFLFI